jgi:LacI family transcriptional regulator
MATESVNKIDILDSRDLYLQVKDSILKYLQDSEIPANGRLPTNREFGRMFSVSTLTVQRAVGELAKEKIVYSRRGRGTFVRNATPGTGLSSRTSLIACVIPSLQSNTVASTIFALDDIVFDDGGEHIIVSNTQYDSGRELRLLDSLLERDIDALVYQPAALIRWQPVQAHAVDERLHRFLARGIPVVMLDEFGLAGRYDTIVPDERKTCELAVHHLLACGHRRLLFFGHTEICGPKVETFQRLVREAGLGEDEFRIFAHNTDDVDATPDGLRAMLDAGWTFTGVVAATDHFALACHRFLAEQGIQCPRDVSIVGSDNLEAVQRIDIPLTTVWCDPEETARLVRRQIRARLAEDCDLRESKPLRVLLEPSLVMRGSTSPPSPEL